VDKELAGRGLAVPFAYVVARTASGQSVVVSGTDLPSARKLNSWWLVSSWPSGPQQALIGARATSTVSPAGDPFTLSFQGKIIQLTPAGTVQTGADEDSRVYLSLDEFERWTGIQPSTIEVAAAGTPEEIDLLVAKLGQQLPTADVRPVRKIVEGETRVMSKTRATLLTSAVLIVLTAALCVLATLIGWVVDRRRDFAIMKALGASEGLIQGFFAAEAAALGATGAVIGFVLGAGIAAWIGRANFHAPVVPRLEVFPVVLLGAVLVALLSAVAPLSVLRGVQPATILRGE